MSVPVVLVHGAAVTGAAWQPVVAELGGHDVRVLERPRTGELARELDWLARRARGAFVVGMSGGATLGLALAAEVELAGALLHEPAVGSLAPSLLVPVAAALAAGGVAGFGAALYGARWTPQMAVDSDESLRRELAMFQTFEPKAALAGQGPVTVSVGALSPAARHDSVAALANRFGYPTVQIPAARHFVALESPAEFATAIRTGIACL